MQPAFYRALKPNNEKSGAQRLYLFQQVTLVSQEVRNLFDSAVTEPARAEIRYVIEALHGQGNVPERKNSAGGLYTIDVSEYVMGLALGRALESHIVLGTNELNSFRNNYSGKYVSVKGGSATEAWL